MAIKKEQSLNSKKLTIKILKKSKWELLFKIVASLLLRGSLLIIPLLYSKVIDYVPTGNYKMAITYCLLTLGLVILRYIFEIINEKSYYKLYSKMYNEYNWTIVKSTEYNSAYSLSRFSLGEYSNMLNNDINIIVDFVGASIIRIIRILEFLVIYLYFFSISKVIFFVSIAVSAVAITFEILRGRKVEKYNLDRKQSFDNYTSTINDTFLGMKEIKSLHILEQIKDKIEVSMIRYLNNHQKYHTYKNGGKFFILAVIETVRYALFIYGIYLISIGEFQLGTVILIYNYYQKMVDNFDAISTMSAEFRNFKVSLKRIDKIFEYLNVKAEYKITELGDVVGEIEFKDILYGNRKDPILKKVSFRIKPNTITVITGKIGSGKSGIFDLIMRINRQHEGLITISGMDINDIEENLYYNLVSLVRKTPAFFEMSIIDNMKLVVSNKKKIVEVCERLGIDEEIKKLKDGYNTSINSREVNTELRQMLGIARTIAKDTNIMLFDEIIDTLDDKNKKIVLDLLQELQQNHTIIIISRAVDMLDFGNQLITMDRNTIKSIKDK